MGAPFHSNKPCWNMVEMTVNDKHYSLLRHKINYSRKKFYDTGESC